MALKQSVEVAGLFTLISGTADRRFLWYDRVRGQKEYNFFLYQSNTWSFFDETTRVSHSINLGREVIYWKKLSTIISLGYVIKPKTNFNLSVSFGIYYRF